MTKRRIIRRVFLITLYSVIMFSIIKHLTAPQPVLKQPKSTFWQIQSIDTMKYSRDASRDPNITMQIPQIVSEVANLHANYIGIDTPYDEEFYPILKAWVNEARAQHLQVWFRGNFSSWEGWFGYPKFDDPTQHHQLTYAFVTKHPDLFKPGDIFTPIPEPENGGLGDPRRGDTTVEDFNALLIASYENCQKAFGSIHKKVTCGYFSVNGDIAKQILTKETVQQIGNVVVIDHYVASPKDMEETITYLATKLGGKIIVGEFGAPIPDINGDMNEIAQAHFIDTIYHVLERHNDIVSGINYWVARGGSTALYVDTGIPKLAANVVNSYYHPLRVAGRITNSFTYPVANASLYSETGDLLGKTDANGMYAVTLVPSADTKTTLFVKATTNSNASVSFGPVTDKTIVENIQLTPSNTSFLKTTQSVILQLLGL